MKIIGFHKPEEPYGCFSNWYPAAFTYEGIRYNCVEQYMMAEKTAMGGRDDLRRKIMEETDPGRMRYLAGKDRFLEFKQIETRWDENCRQIVKRGVKAKLLQNPAILETLLGTGNAVLAECARGDEIWGIGINLHDSDWKDISNWKGKNYLGRILMQLREELRPKASGPGKN